MPRSTTATRPDRLDLFPTGWWRFLPALDSLRKYSFPAARADLIAGISVATVAVPQAMAYALVAGVPVEYGLYTAIVMAAIGAFFASSRQLIDGPTNAISIAVLSALATVAVHTDKVEAIILLTLLIGCVQLAIALFRLGDLTRYISHSVIVGFTLGAAVLIILDQTKNLIGTHYDAGPHEHFITRFWGSITAGGPVDMPTLWVGVSSIALLLLLRRVKKMVGWSKFPALLLTVVLISVATWYMGAGDVAVVGTIPAKLPHFAVPAMDLRLIGDLGTSALAIATLGLLEAIAVSKSIAARTGQRLDVNQICLSQGLANVGGGFFRCIPGSGSFTRSAINAQAGAVTQWAGIFAAAAVAVIVLLFAPYAQFIPKACLAGILIVTALRMIDPRSLIYHLKASQFDAGIVLATAFSAVFISVEFCVLIGVFLSFMLAVPRAGRMLLTEFSIIGGNFVERMPEDPVCPRIVMFGLEGELFFGSASTLEAHFRTIEERLTDTTRVLLLRLKRVRNPDAVCMQLLAQFADRMSGRGVTVMICGVRNDLHAAMVRTDFDMRRHEVFREQKVRFNSTKMAVHRAYELLGDDICDHCTRAPEPKQPDVGPR